MYDDPRGPTVSLVTDLRSLVPPRVDAAIAAVFVALVLAEAAFSPAVTDPLRHAVVGSLAMAVLVWRRRAPLVVTSIVVVVNVLTNPQGEFSTLLSLVLVCFTIGAETEPPHSYLGLLLVLVPFVAVSIAKTLEPSDLAAALVFFVGPWVVGGVVRSRIASTEAAVALAERLEREREAEAARAAAEERTRIARELHDIVSHSISVITIQTQAVRRRLGPDQTAEAADLAAVEATAREALVEMRRLFGVLRTEGEEVSLAPQPGLSELGRLVDKVGAGDMSVSLSVEGEPVDLPAGVDLAAYRIAQEGLTNAARHSGATRADVRLRYTPGRLDIEVEDDGQGLRTNGHAGHGLVGIRERVALYDGTVDLSPSASGGVLLAVRLPLPEAR